MVELIFVWSLRFLMLVQAFAAFSGTDTIGWLWLVMFIGTFASRR